MKNLMKTIGTYTLAFALAAVIPAMILSLFIAPWRGWAFTVAVYLAVYHVLFLALPTFLVFQHRGLINRRTSVTSGFVIGCIPATFFALVAWTDHFNADYLAIILLGGALGALGGWVFWLVIRHTIEDTLAEPPTGLAP